MLELSREGAIGGLHRPAIGHQPRFRPFGIDHWFNSEDHARLQAQTSSWPSMMGNTGIFVFTGGTSPKMRLAHRDIGFRRRFPVEQIRRRHSKIAVKVGQEMINGRVVDTLAFPGMESSQNAQGDTAFVREAAQAESPLPAPSTLDVDSGEQ